ncbi:MAG: hypothetical protein J5I93_30255 [Pirellulaceae bacterium]|nr:hypothetical protein [Pirellulaceae bacterium]
MMHATDCRRGANMAISQRAFWETADEDWAGMAVVRVRPPASGSQPAQPTDHLRRLGDLLPEVLERYQGGSKSPLDARK